MTTQVNHSILLYTKPGCHLCEEILGMIDALRELYTIEMQTVNITEDEDLMAKYRYEIPVLVIDQRATLKAPITDDDLRNALDGH